MQQQLAQIIVPGLVAGLKGVLEGAEEDLQRYAVAIANDMATATSQADLDEIVGQSELLLEINRVRVAHASSDTFRAVIRSAATIAVGFATSGLSALIAKLPSTEAPNA